METLQKAKTGRPHPVCGKCGSRAVYVETDHANGFQSIACRICGNRYPGGLEPVLKNSLQEAIKERLFQGTRDMKVRRDDGTVVTYSQPPIKTLMDELDQLDRKLDNRRRYFSIPKGDEMEEKETQCSVGHCKNCKRDGVKIRTSLGMCHQCIAYVTGYEGDARKKRLKEAAELYRDLEPGKRVAYGAAKNKRIGAVVPPAKKPEPQTEKPAPPEDTKEAKPRNGVKKQINLCFFEGDLPLYNFVVYTAKCNRRTPGQEILFLLQIEKMNEE